MRLSHTHGQMIDSWSSEIEIPKCRDTDDLSNYCIAIKEYVHREKSYKRDCSSIEQARMCITNLDRPSFKEVMNSILQEI